MCCSPPLLHQLVLPSARVFHALLSPSLLRLTSASAAPHLAEFPFQCPRLMITYFHFYSTSELRNAPMCPICFPAPCPLPLRRSWAFFFSIGTESGVRSSPLTLCECALLESISPPLWTKKPSSVKILSRQVINRDIIPRLRLCHTGCVGEKEHVCSHPWWKPKEGFYDGDWVRDGRPGSPLLQVMFTRGPERFPGPTEPE